MPFLGQDWRSPGEQWVRTTEGWERLRMWRLKLLENLNENVIARLLKLAGADCYMMKREGIGRSSSQPHIHITRGTTRELKVQTSLGEAFNRLDMTGAVKDIRRSNYVAKICELLIRNKLSNLSGTAQKVLFNIVEEMVQQCIKKQTNFAQMHRLLDDVEQALRDGYYYHVGSQALWQHHGDMVLRMKNNLNAVEIAQREEDGKVTMSDLPDDCIREILLRMTDHKDIIAAGATETRTNDLSEERTLWRSLCLFHFDNTQINKILKGHQDLSTFTTLEWKQLYKRLDKRFGGKDVFAEMLHLCRHCNALYWGDHGHPCLIPDAKPTSIPLTPSMCIELFST